MDFFPPIVDDPYSFGQIAVANALSDVYAMGGKPLTALNIVGFPVALPKEILGSILVGGSDKAQEAGVLIVGGHTVDDEEPKYGLSVTGIVRPGYLVPRAHDSRYGLSVTGIVRPGDEVTNAGAQPGDNLVLTKPIGTGVITTAAKQGVAPEDVLKTAVGIMSQLNLAASHAMNEVGAHACVDVTGFGLLGHLRGMTRASGVGASLSFDSIPFIPGASELAESGVAPGGTHRNLDSLEADVAWDDSITDVQKILLADAQTSGGLLISVSEDSTAALLSSLEEHGVETRAVIGSITDEADAPSIHISKN